MIKTDDQVIYIDPSSKYTGLKPKDFEPADLVLVTHEHADHCDPDLVKKIRKLGKPSIAPPRCEKKLGMVWTISAGQFMDIGGGAVKVRAVEAYNVKRERKPGEPFHPKGLGVGYIITVDGKKIYHAGDTGLIPEMEFLVDADLDVALIPCDGTYTMDIEEASQAALMIKPKIAIPMHVRDADPNVFKTNVEGQSSIQVVLLDKGEEYTLE
jgi:L-ascorbate metabolism protein UlaG (beta-lactamase superfamily)